MAVNHPGAGRRILQSSSAEAGVIYTIRYEQCNTMPFTPFHFGPALLIGYPLRRRIDLVTFLLANVITDVRATLVFFDVLSGPLHGPIHNCYLGAFGVALGLAGSVLLFTRQYPTTAHEISSRPESVTAVTLASVAGTWLHTTIDAFHHPDIQPFYPLPGNPLYELTGNLTFSEDVLVYGGCALALFLAVGLIGISIVWKRWRATSA